MPSTQIIIRGAVGMLFAVIYGLWTMMATGGGHGNFIWFQLFLYVDFVGLYFPIIAVLSADLRSKSIRVIFGSLIGFNLLVSVLMILLWMLGVSTKFDDFEKTISKFDLASLLFCGFAHFLPSLFFAFKLANSIYLEGDEEDGSDRDTITTIDLS